MNWHARLLVFAQGMDALTFMLFFLLVPASIQAERNPLIQFIWLFGGAAAVGVVKIAVALIVGYRSSHKEPRRRVKFFISGAIASGVVGAGFNLAAIWRYS